MRVTKRDRTRKAFGDRRTIAQDVLTMVLLRWIAVAAVLLGIAVLASGDETRASDAGVDARGAQRDAPSVLCGEERSR
jgi:hypothetical protein